VTSSGIELATFKLVAYCLNQLHYCVPMHERQNISYVLNVIENGLKGEQEEGDLWQTCGVKKTVGFQVTLIR
jgi:hypothetical protein